LGRCGDGETAKGPITLNVSYGPSAPATRYAGVFQDWPEAEAALANERELIVTRDGKPVAKLIRFQESAPKRKRFDPGEHQRRMKRIWGETQLSLVHDFLIQERDRE
jgi:uncharacterized protein with PIN domain/antitoxin (DNA-binding transcriptional repressor) of toxin-antitoxin stability system